MTLFETSKNKKIKKNEEIYKKSNLGLNLAIKQVTLFEHPIIIFCPPKQSHWQ
jgi:hypothetical protein